MRCAPCASDEPGGSGCDFRLAVQPPAAALQRAGGTATGCGLRTSSPTTVNGWCAASARFDSRSIGKGSRVSTGLQGFVIASDLELELGACVEACLGGTWQPSPTLLTPPNARSPGRTSRLLPCSYIAAFSGSDVQAQVSTPNPRKTVLYAHAAAIFAQIRAIAGLDVQAQVWQGMRSPFVHRLAPPSLL